MVNLILAFYLVLTAPSYQTSPLGLYDFCLDAPQSQTWPCQAIVNANEPDSDAALDSAFEIFPDLRPNYDPY